MTATIAQAVAFWIGMAFLLRLAFAHSRRKGLLQGLLLPSIPSPREWLPRRAGRHLAISAPADPGKPGAAGAAILARWAGKPS